MVHIGTNDQDMEAYYWRKKYKISRENLGKEGKANWTGYIEDKDRNTSTKC